MTSGLLLSFEKFCRKKSLFRKGSGVIVAVSGGIDSVVLLHLFMRLQKKYDLQLRVAHFNHKLRGRESEEDELFVTGLADKFDLPIDVERADTATYASENKLSIQEAARELRYQFFSRLSKDHPTYRIATAHNANDNAETLLMNLCRGSGLRGLAGIPVYRPDINVIRPLLFATRAEIEDYAKENRLKYRVDSSNKKLEYRRNYIRKKILPALEQALNPQLISTLGRTAEIFSQLNEKLTREAERKLRQLSRTSSNAEICLSVSRFRKLDPFLQETIIELAASRFTGSPVESEKVRRIIDLVEARSGKRVVVSRFLSVYRITEDLVFVPAQRKELVAVSLKPNCSYQWDGIRFASSFVPKEAVRWTENRNVEYVDADRLKSPLVLRTWKKGDWFIPLGMTGRKKLSDFFIDEKVPLHRRDSVPVLESRGNIVWVCGLRLDDRFRITSKTRRILKLEIQSKES